MKTLTEILKELNININEVTTPEMVEVLEKIIEQIDELIKKQK
jgi:ribosomal protein L12E/L44/L45/RPP1/RPP2